MTLQQLKYVIKIVETGSISAAAKELYVSQPSLSKAVMELEDELDVKLFVREKTGIKLTDEGNKFLIRARQVMDQMDLLEREFSDVSEDKTIFTVSSQHYNFVTTAFADIVSEFGSSSYEFSLREVPTSLIIEDVKTGKSEIGVIYLSKYNSDVIKKKLNMEGLEFEFLFREEPHVCVGGDSELASKELITFEDLKDMPRLSYEQTVDDSFFFYEELYSACNTSKKIMVSDKASLIYFINKLNGYTISTSVLGARLKLSGVKTIPLDSDEYMDIGYIRIAGRPLSEMAERMVELLVEKRELNRA